MLFRPVAQADLDRALSVPAGEPVWCLPADQYRAELDLHRYRPEWTWVAEDGDRLLARAVWWGQADSTYPLALDCLRTDDRVADRAALAADLLSAAHRAFLRTGAPRPPSYNVMRLPGAWRDAPATAAAVAWRQEAARRAGLTVEVERLQYEWTPDAGVPEPGGRLVFSAEPDDEVFLRALLRVAEGSLDAHTREGTAAHGAEATAREALRFYLDRPGRRDWWRLAYTPNGELAGLAIPSATPYHRNVGYLGVVPELRGRGHVAEILAEITRRHAEDGAEKITATTDLGNRPMAAAFERAGYRNTEVRLILSTPE
ncbi:MAG TPA: GNAT family N-acetyltransferase [Actinocatenispora sp.]